MPLLAKVANQDRGEVGIAFGGEHREGVPERPHGQPGDPLLETEPERGRDRTIDDRDRPRRPAEQDRLGERAVHRRLETLDMTAGGDHEMSAPPPKLKKLRKKLDAANAIDRPKMIWMRRRNPPAVSPNASVKPVTMMMITATILATGPWTDSSTCWSGSSHGMPEPAACAVAASASPRPMAAPVRKMLRRSGIRAGIRDKRMVILLGVRGRGRE